MNMGKGIRASYTVEAAGVLEIVLLVVMVLLNHAFHVRAETAGDFTVHEWVERKRHAIENQEEHEITSQAQGMRWSIEITAPVFRPEETLRMWSLAE